MLFIIIPLEEWSAGSVVTLYPLHLFFPLACFLFSSFVLLLWYRLNSHSDQFGIHKPLSTLFWKHYLQRMMRHFKGWWLQQHIIFSCSTWQWVLSHHTNRVILTEGTWGTVSFSVPSCSLPHFKPAFSLLYENIYSRFLRSCLNGV